MQNIYLIKDLSKLSGYSTHAIKFYLRMGLLKEIGRSPVTNFRYFDDTSYERLKQIRELQKQDMTLKQILSSLQQEPQSAAN
jgi:DNA-binding transcriptional MerR regulator